MILIPAYGRDYKSEKEVKKDWKDGKDFQISDVSSKYNGSFTSIRDGHSQVEIRYNKLTRLVLI